MRPQRQGGLEDWRAPPQLLDLASQMENLARRRSRNENPKPKSKSNEIDLV